MEGEGERERERKRKTEREKEIELEREREEARVDKRTQEEMKGERYTDACVGQAPLPSLSLSFFSTPFASLPFPCPVSSVSLPSAFSFTLLCFTILFSLSCGCHDCFSSGHIPGACRGVYVHGKAKVCMLTLMNMCVSEQIGRPVVEVLTVLVAYLA